MKIKSLITLAAAILIVTSASIGFAQDGHDMKKMGDHSEMSEMMKSPHHRMMMAYQQNLNTLANTLADLSKGTEALDPELAKAMVSDIKAASATMDMIHMNHMSKMKPEKMAEMAPMMEKMKAKKKDLADHIAALDAAVNAASIDMKEVGVHAAAIAEMTKPHMEEGSHKDKMKMEGKMKDM